MPAAALCAPPRGAEITFGPKIHFSTRTFVDDALVQPALLTAGLGGLDALALVWAIGQAESGYRREHQVGGPALGYWQMEPATAYDVMAWAHRRRPGQARLLTEMMHGRPLIQALSNLPMFGALMCRVFFLRIPEPLPNWDNLTGIAQYWKDYYNTRDGAGTIQSFIDRVHPYWNT